MYKPKNWDLLSPVEQEAWRERKREYVRKWHAANPEKVREYKRKWEAANPKKMREKKRKWREANPKKAREAQRKYRNANPEKDQERCRKRYHKTRQQTAADQFFIMAGAAEQLTKLKPK